MRKKNKEYHEKIERLVRDYSAFDKQIFANLLSNSNWQIFDTTPYPDNKWEIILDKIQHILTIMCPYKKVKSRKKVIPWLSPEIYKAIREKKASVKKYKTLKEMRLARNRVNSLIDRAKSFYIQNTLYQTVKKPKKFWKLIKNLIEIDDSVDITAFVFKSSKTDLPIHRDDTPAFLNEFFVNIATRVCGPFVPDLNDYNNLYRNIDTVFDFTPPLAEEMYGLMENMDVNSSSRINGINMKMCKEAMDAIPTKFRHLFASSLFCGQFPMAWTCSYVTLLPKPGDKAQPGNWRPISQTNIFAKIIEKIVHKQLLSYFLNNNILSRNQFGFLPQKSTHESIVNVVRHMYSCINNNKIMGVLFLDVAKAFNCINHQVLYKEMCMVGLCDRVISWFTTYLDRSQIIKYGDKMSDPMSISVGIAQGTVLGPLLFIFYTNDCVNTLDKVKISMFADDCILYYCGNNWHGIHQVMQRELNRFTEWTIKNNLRLNESKTQAMIVGNRNKLKKIDVPEPFLLHGKTVKFVKQYNYLGKIIDAELSLLPLYKNIQKRVIDKVYMLKKLRKYLTYKSAVQIYKQTILPIFDYAGFFTFVVQ